MDSYMVSVLCLTYNHESFIADALNGFIIQNTTFKFEVLVHDDASTDNTVSIIKEYAKMYPDIFVPIFQHENQHSKNISIINDILIPNCRGKYIALCEGDDYWTDPFKLQKQFDFMENNPKCSLVTHKALSYDLNKKIYIDYTNIDTNGVLSTKSIIENHLLFPTASMFYRMDFYKKNLEFLKTIKSFDYVLKIMLATEGEVFVLHDIMSVYRINTPSSWTRNVLKNKIKYKKHLLLSIDHLNKINTYRNYKFNNEIEDNILKRKFDIDVLDLNLKAIKSEKYKFFYKKMPFKVRFILYMKKYFPNLYNVVSKVYLKIYKLEN